MDKKELKSFLDEKVVQYNQLSFIESDPISIPHQFTKKEDIEISALLSATIAWGQRKTIINNANKMMQLMSYSPYDFVLNHSTKELKNLKEFKHRTFNGDDFVFFITNLKRIYKTEGGLEKTFSKGLQPDSIDCLHAIESFRDSFFRNLTDSEKRTTKHVSSPLKGSAAKRLIMFLRWMVRDNSTKVDFGIWKTISPSLLSCPLDVHSGNVGRKLGLLTRTQNDWKAVKEMDESLREMDAKDPAKYDFALFGLGVFEKF
jgi:uncharacterized protein (TIGR02757 family)